MRRAFTNYRTSDGGEESLVVENGRVVFRGPGLVNAQAEEVVDLTGKWLAPAFVDSHCHILPTGLDLMKLHLGGLNTHEAVLGAVAERHTRLDKGEWLLAVHYDQTRFPDGLHIDREQLDAISQTRPIILRHVSGHASVANTAALELAGIGPDTKDPEGGSYVRDDSDRMTGVLLETAHEHVTAAAPRPTFEQMVDAIILAGESMHERGIAMAADMMTGRWDLETELKAYMEAVNLGCKVRLRLYMQWGSVYGRFGIKRPALADLVSSMNPDRVKVCGVKLFEDGAIGAGTAAIYGRYGAQGDQFSATGSEQQPPNIRLRSRFPRYDPGVLVSGTLIYPPEELNRRVKVAHDEGYQIAVHSIGDHSTNVVMDAFSELDDPSRHRIEHAMILSDSQIERMASLGIWCTMQPEFLRAFGHAYLRQLGPDRTSSLKRARSVLQAGIRLAFNSDRPIVDGSPQAGIETACNRPPGFVADENVDVGTAIACYSTAGAQCCEDGDNFGDLSVGKLADFNVFGDDPNRSVEQKPLLTHVG